MSAGDVAVTIREFTEGDEVTFRRLNEEWITRYFVLEPKDEYALADPQGLFWMAAAESSWRSRVARRWAAVPW